MNLATQERTVPHPGTASPYIRIRILRQMAEALDDEAEGLCIRLATFDEKHFLITRQIEERQTEISRLQLELEALGSERNALLQQVEKLRTEAEAMREEVLNNEDEIALGVIEGNSPVEGELVEAASHNGIYSSEGDASDEPVYFQRMTLPKDVLV